MRKFAKISALLAAMLLSFSFFSCKNDDDDDEQEYQCEYGLVTETNYKNHILYKSSPSSARQECLLYTEDGTYEKQIVAESDLEKELGGEDGLTSSQIQFVKDNNSAILFFETGNGYILWLYTEKL
ncbi:hypothetical protein [Treponema sp.]|uniref:hypothetical protein n=1 Tax=Treponema sp. TaxID=166 RepID=UPI003F05C2AD